jgi:hypothetical protein
MAAQASAAASCGLPLRVEVDGSDWEAEVVVGGEAAGAEVVPGGGRAHRLAALLLEQHEDEPVDADVGLGALVAHQLPSCMHCLQDHHGFELLGVPGIIYL